LISFCPWMRKRSLPCIAKLDIAEKTMLGKKISFKESAAKIFSMIKP
jgi:hypothetical protein